MTSILIIVFACDAYILTYRKWFYWSNLWLSFEKIENKTDI